MGGSGRGVLLFLTGRAGCGAAVMRVGIRDATSASGGAGARGINSGGPLRSPLNTVRKPLRGAAASFLRAEVFRSRVFAASLCAEVFFLRDTGGFFLAVGDLPRGAVRVLRRGVGSSLWGLVRWVFAMMINKQCVRQNAVSGMCRKANIRTLSIKKGLM